MSLMKRIAKRMDGIEAMRKIASILGFGGQPITGMHIYMSTECVPSLHVDMLITDEDTLDKLASALKELDPNIHVTMYMPEDKPEEPVAKIKAAFNGRSIVKTTGRPVKINPLHPFAKKEEYAKPEKEEQ